MLTLLIVIFGSHMWVQELCRDIYDDNQKLLPMVLLYLKYWQVCWILCWQRMKYSFVSKAEVYNTRRGKGSSKFQKSFAVIKNQEIYFNSTFFYQNNFLLITQNSSWKIRSKQMSAYTTYFLQETKQSRNLQRLGLVKELIHSAWY